MKKITILGGGIIGITNAIAFATHGYKVEVIATHFLWEDGRSLPSFASHYPAALIMPYSIEGDAQRTFELSNQVFEELTHIIPDIVRSQLHLELNEGFFKKDRHFESMQNMRKIHHEQLEGEKILIPKRKEESSVFGYALDSFFVEMDEYKEYLQAWVAKLDIQLTRKKLEANFLEDNSKGLYLNCLGLYGSLIAKDKNSMFAKAGILLRFPSNQFVEHIQNKEALSYSYAWEDFEAYAFLRQQSILFGGTRFVVDAHKSILPQIEAAIPQSLLRWKNGIPYPSYLLEVNQHFLKQLYGCELEDSENFEVLIGLRPVRAGGINREMVSIGGKKLLHSYGFGGSGVTLSWGNALENLAQLEGEVSPRDCLERLSLQTK